MDRKMKNELDRYITGNYGEKQFSQSRKSDTKLKVGSIVLWHDPHTNQDYLVRVIRHGRDRDGTYTLILPQDSNFDEAIKVHRSSLSKL